MEETHNNNRETLEANNPAHYKLITIGIVIGMIGVLLRFTGSWTFIDLISNILFVIGIVICLKAVLTILK